MGDAERSDEPRRSAPEVLASIDASLKALLACMLRIEQRGGKPASSGAPAPGAPLIADDADLDSEHGDPTVRKDPKRWDGESMVGRRYSETSPAFLDCLAGFLDWKAARNAEEGATDPAKAKYAGYDRRDAARARGWAARLRDGWRPSAPTEGAADPSEGW